MTLLKLAAAIDAAVPSHPDAPCVTADDPYPWYGTKATERAEAADKCLDCPIMLACLAGAQQRRERWGVWGGEDFEDLTKHRPARERHHTAGTRRPRTLQPCGTPQAAKAHYKRGEKPCEPCRLAHNAYQAQIAARRRQTA